MYEAGFLNKRVTIQNRGTGSKDGFGYTQGAYSDGNTYWANVTFNKGVQAMREGTVDAYEQCMVRLRYHSDISSDSRIKYNGKVYQQIKPAIILKQEDEIQLLCQEVIK